MTPEQLTVERLDKLAARVLKLEQEFNKLLRNVHAINDRVKAMEGQQARTPGLDVNEMFKDLFNPQTRK